jgi:hypothetical protein
MTNNPYPPTSTIREAGLVAPRGDGSQNPSVCLAIQCGIERCQLVGKRQSISNWFGLRARELW